MLLGPLGTYGLLLAMLFGNIARLGLLITELSEQSHGAGPRHRLWWHRFSPGAEAVHRAAQ
jgi:hypothetical protein